MKRIISFFFSSPDSHVRISEYGRQILDNKEVALTVAMAVMEGLPESNESNKTSIALSNNEHVEIEEVAQLAE